MAEVGVGIALGAGVLVLDGNVVAVGRGILPTIDFVISVELEADVEITVPARLGWLS
jgi:hypothetical protein